MFTVDASYQRLAARYFRKHVKALLRHLRGAADAQDVECVHQARVASRRLRAGFRFFGRCIGNGRLKRWQKAVRRVTDRLGPARDKDVQIASLRDALGHLADPRLRPGVEHLLHVLTDQRVALQGRVVAAVEKALASGRLQDMARRMNRLAARLKKQHVPASSPFLFAAARDGILARLHGLRQWEGSLADPENLAGHHQMRIAAKRLRYTLEICRPAYDGDLDEPITVVKDLQERLGQIHDCDVWAQDVQQFNEEGRTGWDPAAAGRLLPGLEHLRDERLACRRETFNSCVARWSELTAAGFFCRLQQVLDRRIAPSADSPVSPGCLRPATARPAP